MRSKPRYDDVPPAVGGDPAAVAKHTYGWVGNILETASVWYALLYLVQIAGRGDYEFEFKRTTEHLSVAFLHYILFATHKEYNNIAERYYLNGIPLGDREPETIGRHLRFAQNLRGVPDYYTQATEGGIMRAKIARIGDVLFSLDSSGLYDPVARCQDVAVAFEQTPDSGLGRTDIEIDDATGWLKNFNGPAWAAIARHGAEYESPTRVAWVDQTFSVEHNNGNFVNKIQPDGERREQIGDEGFGTNHLSIHEYQNTYLTALLDRNHAGDMRFVFSVATRIDEAFDLGFGFRRAYSEIGQPDGALIAQRRDLRHRVIDNRIE